MWNLVLIIIKFHQQIYLIHHVRVESLTFGWVIPSGTNNTQAEASKDIGLCVISFLSNACNMNLAQTESCKQCFYKRKKLELHSICVVLECNDLIVIIKYCDASNQEVEAIRHVWYRTFCKWMNKAQISDINNKWQ